MGQARARSPDEHDLPTAMPSARNAAPSGSSPSALLMFGPGNPLLRGGRLVHCRAFSSKLGLHPLDANSTLFPQF